jgi:hypothetical protein
VWLYQVYWLISLRVETSQPVRRVRGWCTDRDGFSRARCPFATMMPTQPAFGAPASAGFSPLAQ